MITQDSKKSKQIQRDKIIAYLREKGSATVRDLTIDLEINSPTKRVSELCKLGFPIEKEWVHRINSRGENKRFIRYVMREENGSCV